MTKSQITAQHRRQRSLSGMSTIETLIAVAIAVVLLTQVCALWYYSSRSFAAQAAYTALDQDSQRAAVLVASGIALARADTLAPPEPQGARERSARRTPTHPAWGTVQSPPEALALRTQ